MRIAIIGGGISGLVAAYQLQHQAEVSVFEANDYIGGHTRTVTVNEGAQQLGVDTGFIVFNRQTYPNFSQLLDSLGVASQPSEMSFAVSNPHSGFNYAAPRLSGLFARKSNAFRPEYLRMLWEIVRFSDHGPRYLGQCDDDATIDDLFRAGNYSRAFEEDYLIPMISAIWSAAPGSVGALPARHFLHFFENHGLMKLRNRPQWRVITGGSSNYIKPLIAGFEKRVHVEAPVDSIRRYADHVSLQMPDGETQDFDHVVIAVHSNQALRLLGDASDQEQEILGSMPYKSNRISLHTDTSILPDNRNAWASWNYRKRRGGNGEANLTYHMNRLQSLKAQREYLVSLNMDGIVAPDRILGQYLYSHPQYSYDFVQAQTRHHEISGQRRTHYCGAYWGYGFHEDGVRSALKACEWFGAGTLT